MTAPFEDKPTPRFPGIPTHPEWELFDTHDTRSPAPPMGDRVLFLNPGGVLVSGPYRAVMLNGKEWVPRYWTYYPGVPKEPPPEFRI